MNNEDNPYKLQLELLTNMLNSFVSLLPEHCTKKDVESKAATFIKLQASAFAGMQLFNTIFAPQEED